MQSKVTSIYRMTFAMWMEMSLSFLDWKRIQKSLTSLGDVASLVACSEGVTFEVETIVASESESPGTALSSPNPCV